MMDTASLASRQGAIASSLTEETINLACHPGQKLVRKGIAPFGDGSACTGRETLLAL